MGLSVDQLVDQLFGVVREVGWLVGRQPIIWFFVGLPVGWLVGWSVGPVGWSVGQSSLLVSQLVGRSGLSVVWLVG